MKQVEPTKNKLGLKGMLISAGLILGVLILFSSLSFAPLIDNYFKLLKYDSRTEGKLISVDYSMGWTDMTKYSPREPKVDKYNVVFSYTVNGDTIVSREQIDGYIHTANKLEYIMKSEDKKVKVAYMSKRPIKSVIDLSN
ncbi:hypothetical protein LVD15_18035 [Fulvivirga maritima]|uniref:hypothetical protein n=1 Tax=Fulvivirga maritima TaxID=2904247 RepID=UPI001F204EB2|nr:hypothetical protein [Fulvivirga maritima]UII25195.1 hypothetical protein LVD15_18035 [Fulvivirga maritima]